jgi:hypothetical protein
MIGQNFSTRSDGRVQCLDLQVETLNDAPGLHEVTAIHWPGTFRYRKSCNSRTKSREFAMINATFDKAGGKMGSMETAISVGGLGVAHTGAIHTGPSRSRGKRSW